MKTYYATDHLVHDLFLEMEDETLVKFILKQYSWNIDRYRTNDGKLDKELAAFLRGFIVGLRLKGWSSEKVYDFKISVESYIANLFLDTTETN